MLGEVDLILCSEYKYLIEVLNGIYTASKLNNETDHDPMLIKLHDQVNGGIGWSVFIGGAKFNLGIMDYTKNELIISYMDFMRLADTVQELLDNYGLNYKLRQQENHFVVTICINYQINESNIKPIIELVELSLKN